jgi:hypothetical protein
VKTSPRSLRLAATVLLAAPVLGLAAAAPAGAAADVPGGTAFASPVALPISVPGSFTASNAGSSSAGTGSSSAAPFWNNAGWYSYTPAQDERISVRATSISPAGWDNTLEVWTAGGTLVEQVDDVYELDALLVAPLTGGVQYRIGLGGYNPMSQGTATLAFANQVPDAPTGVTASVGDGTATVSWTAPDDHGSPVTGYEVECQEDGGAWTSCATETGTPPATTTTVSGLTNGAGYRFRVVATSLLGDSLPSAAVPTSSDPQAVPRGTSTTTATAPASVVRFDDADVTATVVSGGNPVTGGTVTVSLGSTVVGTGAVAAGTTTVDVDLPVGAHTLTVAFGGTAAAAGSSTTVPVTVTKAAQTLTFPAPTGMVTGDQQTLRATSSAGLPVAYTAAGACRVTGSRVTAVGTGTCTLTAAQAGSADHTAAADVVRTLPVAAPVELQLTLETPLEAKAAGAPVVARGEGLLPGSTVTLELHSTPRRLLTGVVAADGTVVLTTALPADVEPGVHELVLVGTGIDGSPVRSVLPLIISADGLLTQIGDQMVPVRAAAATAPALAYTGSPAGTVALAGIGLVLAGAGALVAGRRRSGRADAR